MCNKTTPKHPNLFHKTVIREHCNKKVKRKYLKNALTHTRHDTTLTKVQIFLEIFHPRTREPERRITCAMSCVRYIFSFLQISPRQAMMRPAATATQFKMSREKGTRNATQRIWHLTVTTVYSRPRVASEGKGQSTFCFFPKSSSALLCSPVRFLHLFQFFSSYICTLL